jgi:hypothetical protein
MIGGQYLREPFRLGGILLMTAGAKGGDSGKFGLVRAGILKVPGLRTVAGLAGDVGMLAFGPGVGLIAMTNDALSLSGVSYWPFPDVVEGPRAVVAVLSEGFWDKGGTQDEKHANAGQHDNHETNQMSGVPEGHFHELSYIREGGMQFNRHAWSPANG